MLARHAIGFCLPALLALVPVESRAGFIELAAGHSLAIRNEGQTVLLGGGYAIENRGDEVARAVSLTLQLGHWSVTTEEVDLAPGARHDWALEHSLPLERLACSDRGSDPCAGQELPVVGAFPLRMTRHYKDANGYAFSNVSVEVVGVGEASPEAAPRIGVETLEVDFRIEAGAELRGRLEVRNLSESPRTLSVALALPRELASGTAPFRLELGPGRAATAPIALANRTGLMGSVQEVVVILQWTDGGPRHTATASAFARIESPDRSGTFLGVLAGAMAVALAVLGLAGSRRRAALPPGGRSG